MGNAALAARVDAARYVDEAAGVGLPTLRDILAELEKPGRDPRAEFSAVPFDPGVTELTHVKPGMILNGVVTNIAALGAFVDVALYRDGLAHVSELANRFVKDPGEVVRVGDGVRLEVLSVDVQRRGIGLSLKALAAGSVG